MAIPSPIKIKKDGVEYISNVDRVNYTLNELVRAALRDTGKFICSRTRKLIKRKTGKSSKNTQYWVRSRSGDLQVGFKPAAFYAGFQEVGTSKLSKKAALHSTVANNIDEIRKIQGKYLSAIENENRALGLISDDEYEGE